MLVPFQNVNSAIRLDDVESYIRMTTYRNRLFRQAKKLTSEFKWLSYTSRFDIWASSRAFLADYKTDYYQKKFLVNQEISRRIKDKLLYNGVVEDKIIQSVIDKYTVHLKGEEFVSRQEQLLNSYVSNHEQPPIIISSNFEMKLDLQEIAKGFGITGDLDLDNGHSFTY